MPETLTVRDPFLGKDVEISSRLVDRLRGKYAMGPITPSGEPEFGWRIFETPQIQKDAAARIEQLEAAVRWACGEIADADGKWFGDHEPFGERRPKPFWWRTPLRRLAGLDDEQKPQEGT